MGSSMGAPHMEPMMAMRATTEDTASVRWCQAFAISTWEFRRFPTAFVAWVGGGGGGSIEVGGHSGRMPKHTGRYRLRRHELLPPV